MHIYESYLLILGPKKQKNEYGHKIQTKVERFETAIF